MILEKKRCSSCSVFKGKPQFHRDSSKRDGLASRCRVCNNESSAKFHAENRSAANEARRDRTLAEDVEVVRAKRRAYYAKNREYIKERSRSRQAEISADPVRSAEQKAKQKAWREANRPQIRDRQYQWYYGITLRDYEQRCEEQGHGCLVCKRPSGSLVVDHCHVSGFVRGLLCAMCNTAIGNLGDDSALIPVLVEFFEQHPRDWDKSVDIIPRSD